MSIQVRENNLLEEQKSLVLNGIIIKAREKDNFINATQMCKAGNKRFKNWTCLENTKILIETLKDVLKSEG